MFVFFCVGRVGLFLGCVRGLMLFFFWYCLFLLDLVVALGVCVRGFLFVVCLSGYGLCWGFLVFVWVEGGLSCVLLFSWI